MNDRNLLPTVLKSVKSKIKVSIDLVCADDLLFLIDDVFFYLYDISLSLIMLFVLNIHVWY